MKKILQILSIFGIMLSISIICNSCKTDRGTLLSNDVSKDQNSCECNDLQCWQEITDKNSQASFECASKALDTAVGLADNVSGLLTLLNSIQVILTSLDAYRHENKNALDVFVDIGEQLLQNLNKATSQKCESLEGGLMNDFYSLIQETISLYTSMQKNNNIIPSAFVSKILEYQDTIGMIMISGMENVTGCISDVIKNTKNQKLAAFKVMLEPLNEILKVFLVADVLRTCGVNLYGASITLTTNIGCAIEDMGALSRSYEAHKKMNDNFLNEPLDCDKEIKNVECSYSIATRQGIALDKIITQNANNALITNALASITFLPLYTLIPGPLTGPFTIEVSKYMEQQTRAKFCLASCYNHKSAKEQCFSNDINLGNKLSGSKQNCQTRCAVQEGDCVNHCRSYCCDNNYFCIRQVEMLYEEGRKNQMSLKRNWNSNNDDT